MPRCDGIGDVIASALNTVGLTEERVETWLGDCGCKERRAKLNQLTNWAIRVLTITQEHAIEYLNQIVHD